MGKVTLKFKFLPRPPCTYFQFKNYYFTDYRCSIGMTGFMKNRWGFFPNMRYENR